MYGFSGWVSSKESLLGLACLLGGRECLGDGRLAGVLRMGGTNHRVFTDDLMVWYSQIVQI